MIKITTFITTLVLLCITALFVYGNTTAPTLFNIDDAQAKYRVVHFGDCCYGINGTNGISGTNSSNGNFTVLIGSSPFHLKPYVGKVVKISGKFTYREYKQILIRPEYTHIYLNKSSSSKSVVVDLDTIRVVE